MRDFLKGLELDKETIDTIMAEHGRLITGSKEKITELEKELKIYETEITNLKEDSKDNEGWKSKFEKLDQKVKENEAELKAEKEDAVLTKNITDVFGSKKFTSEYAKNGLISDIKAELQKEENKGKGIIEIFEILTKDSTGIFENPNQPADMPGMGEAEMNADNGADGFVSIIQENQRK